MKKSNINERNGQWKGDRAGYNAIRDYIKRRLEKPSICKNCKKETSFLDLVSISGECKRNINDFRWLCRSCHMKEDGRLNKLLKKGTESIIRKRLGNLFQCTRCKEFKLEEKFTKNKKSYDKLDHHCKDCKREEYIKKYGIRKKVHIDKLCIDCGIKISDYATRCMKCKGNPMKKHFFCVDCGKELSSYRSKRCMLCANKNEDSKNKKSIAKIGDKNPMKRPEVRKKVSEAFKIKYKLGELISPFSNKEKYKEIRILNSKRMKLNNPNKDGKTFLGKHCSEEHKKKIGMKNKGKQRTEEERKRMSISRKGKKLPKLSITLKRLYREGVLIPPRGMLGKSHKESTKEKMKIVRQKQVLPKNDTKIEVKIQNFLKQLGIEFYTHQYIKEIEHSYQCDIFIPSMNLIIECDGDYFHCNPLKYSADFVRNYNKKIIITAKDIWERDKIRTQELKDKGYRVLRLWETEINKMNLNDFKHRLNNG